jgi:tetratricopeptide (TPR) repeat protein
MKFTNYFFTCILSVCFMLFSSTFVEAQPSNWLEKEKNKQFSKSNSIVAQNNLPDVPDAEDAANELPNLLKSGQSSDNFDRQLNNFKYEDADYWQNLCDLYERTNQLEKANQACNKMIELEDEDADVWLTRGNNLFASGEYVEAIASFDRAIDIADNYSLALTNRCASYFQLALYEDAIIDCQTALDENGDWKDASPVLAWYYQGLIFSRLGRFEAALTNYEKAIAHSPENNLVHAERCRVLLDLKRQGEKVQPCFKDKAITRYELALADNSNDIIAWTNQGLFFEALDNREKAAYSYDRALELSQSSFVLTRRCIVANDLNSYEEALGFCDSAINEGDGIFAPIGLSTIWSQRSRALVGLKRYQEALDSAERSIALDFGIAESWNNKGVSLWFLDKPRQALIALERAINLNPRYIGALFNYGRTLSSLGQYREALNSYDRALQVLGRSSNINAITKSELTDLWVNKSFAQFNIRACEQAFKSTQEAISLTNKSFAAWYNQGIALACLGRYQSALDAYAQADKIKPKNLNVYTGRAIALEKLGSYQEALGVVEEALNINSDYQAALNLRERLLRTINQVNLFDNFNF